MVPQVPVLNVSLCTHLEPTLKLHLLVGWLNLGHSRSCLFIKHHSLPQLRVQLKWQASHDQKQNSNHQCEHSGQDCVGLPCCLQNSHILFKEFLLVLGHRWPFCLCRSWQLLQLNDEDQEAKDNNDNTVNESENAGPVNDRFETVRNWFKQSVESQKWK